MALKTDWKDFIPPTTGRVYRPTYNTDGTMSLTDVTAYLQEGDQLGAADINAINKKINSYEGTVDGTVKSADKLKTARNIGNAAFDGTANITLAQIGAAPTNHASTGTTYGVATTSHFGHVALSDSISNTSGVATGVAATALAVNNVNAKLGAMNLTGKTTMQMTSVVKTLDATGYFTISGMAGTIASVGSVAMTGGTKMGVCFYEPVGGMLGGWVFEASTGGSPGAITVRINIIYYSV